MTETLTQLRRREPVDSDHGPEFHLYPKGSNVALCGHLSRVDEPPRPYHRGPDDCEKCWEIELKEINS